MPQRFVLRSALSIAVVFAASVTPASAAQVIAFENAQIVDPAQESVRPAVLLVRDGRIARIATRLPEGFDGERVDLEGRWVLPGLVDMHTHSFGNMSPAGEMQFLGTPGTAQVALYTGVTAFLDLFGMEDAILSFRDAQRRGEHGGAAVFASGPCLTATNGHCSEYGIPTRIVNTPAEAVREVDALAAKQPDVVKIVYDNASYGSRRMPTVDRVTLEAVVSAARRHGLKTVVHVGTWDDVRDAVQVGARAVTHTPGPAPVPDDVVDLMVRAGAYHIPTLGVQSEYRHIAGDSTFFEAPLLRAVTTQGLRDGYRASGAQTGRFAGWIAWQESLAGPIEASVKRLADAGVPMLTGTDGGNVGVFQGYSVHRELELLVRAGLSPWEALRAATTNAASFLEQSWGMDVGDEATFIVLTGSPIERIDNTTRIHAVVQRGVVVDRDAVLPGR